MHFTVFFPKEFEITVRKTFLVRRIASEILTNIIVSYLPSFFTNEETFYPLVGNSVEFMTNYLRLQKILYNCNAMFC